MRPTTVDSLGCAKRHLAQMLQVTVCTFRRFWVGRRVCDSPKAVKWLAALHQVGSYLGYTGH
jgi:hypothetical protein